MTKPQDEIYKYQSGFGNQFESEALPGALPVGQNTPLYPPYGLFTEQLNGTAFTVPRNHFNQRSWLYRIHPSVNHNSFSPYTKNKRIVGNFNNPNNVTITPDQLRWLPFEIPKLPDAVDFVDGISTLCGAGDPSLCAGMSIHIYLANSDMKNRAMMNSDGDFLIVPQQGTMDIQTEFGKMTVRPNEICVIQRGIKFKVEFLKEDKAAYRGYIFEVYGANYELPELGPIGSNGLANVRDFLTPVAAYDENSESKQFEIVQKFHGQMFSAVQNRSPFDVVAWHGNYAPYKYDLDRFCAIDSVTFDISDPSIYTVLTCKSQKIGTATFDFMIIPPRYSVQKNTLRIPYFHRNVMTEFAALLFGGYGGEESSFQPGGAVIHSSVGPHGPETQAFEKAVKIPNGAFEIGGGSQILLCESMYQLVTTKWAIQDCGKLYKDYSKEDWGDIKVRFNPHKRDFDITDYTDNSL
ncbi:hypothetical protein BB561_006209 [Smittium simulii]|uniref:homogentisate 1,2-dioxygenase n=1 Tax=Smittium simulii TaxID=133385 RepID=A0A2T9Y5S6_9FUNG|nr:hypothetical protein BB561_006209 [Smittium simulii]